MGSVNKVNVGDLAPHFTSVGDDGKEVSLNDFGGKTIVLYFYPKDMTPGCTLQAQDFSHNIKEFEKSGAVVVGVSKDNIKRHQSFRAKNNLNFILLSDEDGGLCEDYGVWQKKKLYGREFLGIVRTTFIIDNSLVVQHVWQKVKVKGHVEEVLAMVQRM